MKKEAVGALVSVPRGRWTRRHVVMARQVGDGLGGGYWPRPATTVRKHGGESTKMTKTHSDPNRVGWERRRSRTKMGWLRPAISAFGAQAAMKTWPHPNARLRNEKCEF